MRPHLVVYLDIPVDVALQRIKERGLTHEVNSTALTPEFMSHMEQVYKQQYLKQMRYIPLFAFVDLRTNLCHLYSL